MVGRPGATARRAAPPTMPPEPPAPPSPSDPPDLAEHPVLPESPELPELPERFDPEAVRCFRYVGWSFDAATGEAVLRYALDDLELRERFVFPLPDGGVTEPRLAAAERLLAHLFLAAGVSYYKCAAPPRVRVETGTWDPADVDVHRELFAHGLGEYAWHNGLDPELRPAWEYASVTVASAPPGPVTGLAPDRGVLVPVGGGKDSCVTTEVLRDAGLPVTLVTVSRYPVIQDVIDRSGLPDLLVRRTLDPRLGELNRRGARNGHVPITAVVSLTVLVTAALHGFEAVVMSNERSASEGNVVYRGVEINHQWSKGEVFEASLQAALARVTPELAWFSLLRPLSELSIAREFAARAGRYLDVFSSCNGAFRQDPSRRVDRWCGRCPKCQFVHLALATSLGRDELLRVFGEDVFSVSPVEGFEALLGLTAWKPFECVGEVQECRVALRLVVERPAWAGHPVLEALDARLAAAGGRATDADVAAVFARSAADLVPERYRGLVP